MLMTHNLTGLSSGSGKAHSEHYAVQSALQHNHQVLTGHALHSVGLYIIVMERFLQHTVNELGLLLFTKLQTVLTYLLADSGIGSVGFLVIAQIGRLQAQGSASL